jgi:hypothetical protein
LLSETSGETASAKREARTLSDKVGIFDRLPSGYPFDFGQDKQAPALETQLSIQLRILQNSGKVKDNLRRDKITPIEQTITSFCKVEPGKVQWLSGKDLAAWRL